MTNGDKIRAMSDEELARNIMFRVQGDCSVCPASKICRSDSELTCKETVENWLRQEAKDE